MSAKSSSGGTREHSEWTGLDTPDFARTKRPTIVPPPDASGDAALPGTAPFILHSDGVGWIWVARASRTARCPRITSRSSPRRQSALRAAGQPGGRREEAPRQPLRRLSCRRSLSVRADDLSADRASHRRRHVADAPASRRAAAGAFCEISPELAAEVGARHGEDVTISSPRGSIVARALVTARMRPLQSTAARVTRSACPITGAIAGLVTRRRRQRSGRDLRRAERQDHGIEGARLPDRAATTQAGTAPRRSSIVTTGISHRLDAVHRLQSLRSRLQGVESDVPSDGFDFTGLSYDNTAGLGHSTGAT